MGRKLKTLKPRMAVHDPTKRVKTVRVSDRRITGTTLQNRRWKLWKDSPYCAFCGRVVAFPEGFELDHKVPLFMGGEDVEANCQILCVWYEIDDEGKRVKAGCHASKTADDLKV